MKIALLVIGPWLLFFLIRSDVDKIVIHLIKSMGGTKFDFQRAWTLKWFLAAISSWVILMLTFFGGVLGDNAGSSSIRELIAVFGFLELLLVIFLLRKNRFIIAFSGVHFFLGFGVIRYLPLLLLQKEYLPLSVVCSIIVFLIFPVAALASAISDQMRSS